MAADLTAAIALTGVAVERSGTRVVHGVDLTVAAGEWMGLIGANGSGKTSLLRALAGRLPFAAGRCTIDGVEQAHDRHARARRCGFAPPPERLPDGLRVRDLLTLTAGTDAEAACARLGAIGGALGIDRLLPCWVGDCSAGMRQRAAIALAFAGGQSLVVLDEPFNWLDPVAAFDLRQALRERCASGLTLVTALHDLATLTMACDAGAVLASGRVALAFDRAMLAEAAGAPAAFERRMIDLLRAGGQPHGTPPAV